MVERWLEWIFELENIRIGRDAPLILKWNAELPAWLLFGCALIGLLWVVAVYRREETSLTRRLVLATLRVAVIALVACLLCQPSLVFERNRVEPSHVALLVDSSQSMGAKDRYADQALAATVAAGAGVEERELGELTRLELIRRGLVREGTLDSLLTQNELKLCTFAGQFEAQGYVTSASDLNLILARLQTIQADGQSTDLAGAILHTVDDSRGRRLAGVVLASDGQSTERTGLNDAIDHARGRGIPIFPIRIGSPVHPKDVDLGPVRCEPEVFVGDLVAIEVQLSASGLTEPVTVPIRLTDDSTGISLAVADVHLTPEHAETTLELQVKPDQPGSVRYRIDAEPIDDEDIVTNNVVSVDLSVLDDRVRVLYVEGYPRYEYRYLKNALLREKTAKVDVLLLEADREFVQEGSEPIRHFPDTPEELNRFDVVLFGDVDPRGGWMTPAQINMLLDFVGNNGGGFGLIAGERNAPHRFLSTALAKLLPVRLDTGFHGQPETPLTAGYHVSLTRQGRESRLFQFVPENRADLEKPSDRAQLFEELPLLYWTAKTLGAKPGATVLAEHPTLRTLDGAMPILVMGRYGAGRIMFQATDDTWRWRRHTGELVHDAYWVQIVRELMRGERVHGERRYTLRTDRRVYSFGKPMHVQVEVLDSRLLALHPESIEITVRDRPRKKGGSDDEQPGAMMEDFAKGRFDVRRLDKSSPLYEGVYVPPRPGAIVLSTDELKGGSQEQAAEVTVRVEKPDLEARRPEADHQTLQRIADATGGRVLAMDELVEGFASIKNRSVRIPDDIVEPLWDSKVVLMLFVILLGTEWILRKAFGLL